MSAAHHTFLTFEWCKATAFIYETVFVVNDTFCWFLNLPKTQTNQLTVLTETPRLIGWIPHMLFPETFLLSDNV